MGVPLPQSQVRGSDFWSPRYLSLNEADEADMGQ